RSPDCMPDRVELHPYSLSSAVAWARAALPRTFFPGMPVCPAREPGARPRAILNFELVQPLVMRVLIVEDDNALADGLMRTLRQSGFAVDNAEFVELAYRDCAQ